MKEVCKIEFLGKGITTIQDVGRTGYRAYGIPESGFMDFQSAVKANWLAGNDKIEPLFEVFYTGFKIKVDHDISVGICGAASNVFVNEKTVSARSTIYLTAGDILEIKEIDIGQITYCAFLGGLSCEKAMDSSSTYLPGHFGGYNGRLIKGGDILKTKVPVAIPKKRELPLETLRYISSNVTLRFVPGPEYDLLSTVNREILHACAFTLSSDSNRMGYRFKGVALDIKNTDRDSVPVVKGTIQLLPNGQLVVLMADSQTTGGYPRIGTIILKDLDDLAQLTPGRRARFLEIDLEKATEVYLLYQEKMGALMAC